MLTEEGGIWRRLIVLGVVVVLLACLGLAPSLAPASTGHEAGLSAIFGGIVIAIVALKMRRDKSHLHWFLFAASLIVLGVLIQQDAGVASDPKATCFFLALAGLSYFQYRLGSVQTNSAVASWIRAGGLTNLLIAASAIVDRVNFQFLSADTILSATVLITGISIAGGGIVLRPSD